MLKDVNDSINYNKNTPAKNINVGVYITLYILINSSFSGPFICATATLSTPCLINSSGIF